ncbi:hypothetical protein L596_023313 [Steinernema carpocapsae]|uniref:Peptidase C1A papain C-terminal domain-containing protein n=1 Tax=Steinernema carpocapsae TaxID=34508 RepID=A0A4U5MDB6_STECR|nr:hypothetical protein L596_023313 [Steinernema carpocapsae]
MILSMLLIGYGIDPQKGDYWIIKNGMRKDWGKDERYMRIARSRENHSRSKQVFWGLEAKDTNCQLIKLWLSIDGQGFPLHQMPRAIRS